MVTVAFLIFVKFLFAQDFSKDMYGVEPLNQSQSRPGLQWARIGDLHSNMAGQTINLRARVHTTRGTGM
jgi:aspartyl-tRNA synthetase